MTFTKIKSFSFTFENVSDLMVHYNKSKYVERIKKSTERLNKLNIQNIKKLEKIQQNFKIIDFL